MLITLTCPPLTPHPAACQTMREEQRGIETNRKEMMARKTVTDGEGVDLRSLVKQPSIIDEWRHCRHGDPADHNLASDTDSMRRMAQLAFILQFGWILSSLSWLGHFWMSQMLCKLQILCCHSAAQLIKILSKLQYGQVKHPNHKKLNFYDKWDLCEKLCYHEGLQCYRVPKLLQTLTNVSSWF